MPKHNPLSPLPDPTHEAYLQARVRGVGPTEAALATGCEKYRDIERRYAFKARLRALTEPSAHEPKVKLEWLVVELKQTASAARAANQFKNANEALAQLAELYAKYPGLRGDDDSGSRAVPTTLPASREERRAAHRAELSVVPEAAANE